MRILYYNWVDYLDEENRGGGVSVYQRNLMRAQRAKGNEVTFISSGISYDLAPAPPRWEPMRHGPSEDRAHRYEIVNSGVLAPAHHAFGDPAQLDHTATEEVMCDFVAATGPYDVVHFNNLEGIPVAVFAALKARWPNMKIVLSLHNYYPFCPQVNLWREEQQTCTDFAAGQHCITCLTTQHDPRLIRLANGLARRLKLLGLQPGSWAFDTVFWWTLRLGKRAGKLLSSLAEKAAPSRPQETAAQAHSFAQRRDRMVQVINTHCDQILCVSDAVRRLAGHYGLAEPLLCTSYIGTQEAARFGTTDIRHFPLATDGTITLAYLGYMRRDKGFFFLLNALESLPDDLCAQLRLVIAARRSDEDNAMARLDALGQKLAGLTYEDGYSHDTLDQLLASVDVGVIPVLWHDNLPQVAIEMHARHIPLLCADMGGAQELGRSDDMVFSAGSVEDFHARLTAVIGREIDFKSYWNHAMPPVEMSTHLDHLDVIYRPL